MGDVEGHMTVTEAAKRHGCSRRALIDAVQRGAIRHKRVGNMYLLDEKDVAAYHERTAGKAGRPPGSKDKQPRTRGQSRPPKEQPL
jgi:excisionase family DNA binding protein